MYVRKRAFVRQLPSSFTVTCWKKLPMNWKESPVIYCSLLPPTAQRPVMPWGLRLKLAERLGLAGDAKRNFLWVVDFPLLEYDEEEKRYMAVNHPTGPRDEDMEKLDSRPQDVRAKAYDLVLNGVEIGGGSIRIHWRELQEKVFSLQHNA